MGGTDTTFAYDDWGRMTSKDDGTYTATYAYKYADKLASISTNFPGESIISYDYGGDGKRREYTTGGNTNTWYWDAGWNVINYETYTGSKFTYVRDPAGKQLAKWNGTNPTGDGTIWRYYHHDIIRSARMGTRDDKSIVKNYEYTPYGEIYSESGWAHTAWKFTSAHGPTDGLYYFPFRYYSPSLGRWMTREPLGMLGGPNLYPYCRGNPVSYIDPDGRFVLTAIAGLVGGAIIGAVKTTLKEKSGGEFWKEVGKGALVGLAVGVAGSVGATLAANAVAGTAYAGWATAAGALGGGTASGLVSGTASAIQGGSFGSGFAWGFVGGAVSGAATGIYVGESMGGFANYWQAIVAYPEQGMDQVMLFVTGIIQGELSAYWDAFCP